MSPASDSAAPAPGANAQSPPVFPCTAMPAAALLAAALLAAALLSATLASCSNERPAAISASGTVEVIDVTVSARVPGEIERRYVDEGSVVKAGDTIALIRHLTAPLELRQAQAAVSAAGAALDLLRRGSRQEDIRQAAATLENLAADLRRAEELFGRDLISEREVSEARTRHAVAREAHEKLKNGPLPEEIERARAQHEQAVAQEALVRKKLDDTRVISPVDGVVTLRAVEAGEMVQAGSAIVKVSVLETVRLVIYLPETELGRVKLGDGASVTIDAWPDRTFQGKVVYISPTAEFTPKNVQTKEERAKLSFAVKIEVENPGGELKPGMPADAVITVTN